MASGLAPWRESFDDFALSNLLIDLPHYQQQQQSDIMSDDDERVTKPFKFVTGE